MLRANLLDKLNNKEYLNSLCMRRFKELMFCEQMLDKEDLRNLSSIQIAYKKARDRFIEEYLSLKNKEFVKKIKTSNRIPIFNKEEILRKIKGETSIE